MPQSTALKRLHQEIDARVDQIRTTQGTWPCGKGCDGCCHRLANIPSLTPAEWALLKQGIDQLPNHRKTALRDGMRDLAEQSHGPYRCPLLDRSSGACLVYLQRPVACRTYGFYVQKAHGLYCAEIEQQVDQGAMNEVVWGNHDRIDRELSQLGSARPLTDWYAEWQSRPESCA